MNYLDYYSLEHYLFDVVSGRFHREGSISAFDFFSIVIWKANRAKSIVAKRLIATAGPSFADLESICRSISHQLHVATSRRERLQVLMVDWNFRLPMASAILCVLWPDEFGVYDIRVCDELKKHQRIGNWIQFDRIWTGYEQYLDDVRNTVPHLSRLRDKDRYLWGRSAACQLERDLANGFAKASKASG